MKISKIEIINSLKKLGVKEGDILFVTADIMKVGYFNENREKTIEDWIEIFKTLIGEEGALIFASYTAGFLRFKKKNIVFEKFSEATTGSLPNALINHPDSFRSLHPTNSVIGIGSDKIKYLFEQHNHKSLSYKIMGDLIKIKNCKFLLLGTLDKFNAPQAMHSVQEDLGYTKFSPFKYLIQTYFIINGRKKLYTKKDFGGCSRGAYRLYGPLIVNNAIKISQVGRSLSGLMNAKKSYDVIMKEFLKNKKIIQCDNSDCIDCYGNPIYNGFRIIPFYIMNSLKIITRIFKQ